MSTGPMVSGLEKTIRADKMSNTRGPGLMANLASDFRRNATTSKNATNTSDALLLNIRNAMAVGSSVTIQSGALLAVGTLEEIEN